MKTLISVLKHRVKVMYAKRAYISRLSKGVWALVQSKMEFEELKVEIPADDSDKEEKDLPSNFVSKNKI